MADENKTQSLGETFRIKSGGDNESQIRRIFEEVKNSSITHENHEKYYDKIMNTLAIIHAQIENEYSQYLELEAEYAKLGKQERTKKAIEDKIVPLDVFATYVNMSRRERQITSWLILAHEITETSLKKFGTALSDAKAFEIKRDALREMREDSKRVFQLFEEIMTSRFASMDEKFLAGLRQLQRENQLDRRESLNLLSSAVVTNAQLMGDATKNLFEMISRSYPDSYDDVKKLQSKFDQTQKELRDSAISQIKSFNEERPNIVEEVERIALESERARAQKAKAPDAKKKGAGVMEIPDDYRPPKPLPEDDDEDVLNLDDK